MIQGKRVGDVQYWQYPMFNDTPGISHLISGNNLQINRGSVPGLNFSFNVQDNTEVVTANRNMLGTILFGKDAPVIIPDQTHSDHIGIVTCDATDKNWPDTDALITNVPGIVIGVLSADCVPVLLIDPVTKTVAAIHAGWKGTAKQIVAKTIAEMVTLYGCHPSNILAGIGPSISSASYEVGEDVAANFPAECLTPSAEGKSCLDLWQANERQLRDCGIPADHISRAGICTFKNPSLFYSARRDSIRTGRMVSAIGILQG